MAGFQFRESFAVSPGELFDYLVSAEKLSAVVKNFRKVEKIGDEPLSIGTKFRQIRGHGGHDHESIVEVTAFERPSIFQVSVEKAQLSASYTYSLIPNSVGTQIILTAQVKGEGLRNILAWIVAQRMRQKDTDLLKRLKSVIEEEEGARAVEQT